ncbi:MAG: uroporphyrinogen decarboxylase [Hamadaea sp.]|uniref:uroporphyrinogen decarboxylase n=1 Tax=Hamadaea sp. TaxID=2024425 RepID=UPI0017DB5C62|nr:uroporphyrinogen decarboxylase [Hamadaea sp.]NUR72540.1 uroporphyrinogen decarboxylase [Hamadaea sp.]NUT22916.1 uroporphyrinogen decarboxylase [Hamadaea sp.]
MTSIAADPVDSVFVRACRGEPVEHTPVWFMRQAGRSLPEYRELRAEAGLSMLEACRRPDLVTEITLQPVRRHGVDAAVFYSDIVVPVAAAGVGVEIVAGTGPVVADPIRSTADLARIGRAEPADLSFVEEAVRMLIPQLEGTPLIGFAGAPFTLASYLIEGGPSKSHAKTKALMHSDPQLWHGLAERLAQITSTFLRVQIDAGASAVQLFDSWAGALSEADYRRFVLPHSAAVLQGIGPVVPRIHFGVGTAHLLTAMAEAGADVVGVDWRTPLDQAASLVADVVDLPVEGAPRLGARSRTVQGNLDPALLGAPWEVVDHEVRRVLAEGEAAPGHVFNLGHGVPPDADPVMLTRIVELVHKISVR